MDMDENTWIWAVVAVGIGLLVGEIAGSLVRAAVSRGDRSDLARERGRQAASGVFWGSVAVGLVIAAGILDRSELEEFWDALGDGMPAVLLAAVVVIAGYAVGLAIAAAVGQSALRATGVRQVALERALKVVIVAIGAVVALRLGGVDDTLLVVLIAGLVGAPALALSLLTARGAETVASQVAAGRALRNQVRVGWMLEAGDGPGAISGEVVALHSTFVEVEAHDGGLHHVPNRWLLDHPFRAGPADGGAAARRI